MLKVNIVTLTLLILTIPSLALAGSVDNSGQVIPVPHQNSLTSITEYTDQAAWESAVSNALVVNPYGDLPEGTIVTNQYAALGATYTDGNDVTVPYSNSIDGMLLSGSGRIYVDFDMPVYAVGVNFPGAVKITAFLGGMTVFTSSDFGGSGSYFFGGVVSTEVFDSIEIMDWMDDTAYIDALNFNVGTVASEERTWSQVKSLFQ